MGLWRFIKSWKNICDSYTGTVHCKKPLPETVNYIKDYLGKGSKNTGANYHIGRYKVVVDKDWNVWYEIKKEIQEVQAVSGKIMRVLETMRFSIQHYQGVVHTIQVEIKAPCSKICFDEFEKDFLEAIPDVVGAPAATTVVNPIEDLSKKCLVEILDIFDKKLSIFNEDTSKAMFENIKHIKAELSKRIDEMDIKERASYAQALAQINTFITAIDMQFSNPAMAAGIKNVAGTYVSSMKAEISKMVSFTN